MPLKRCTQDGKSGWKFGDSGKCYVGPEGKKLAIKQGIKIHGPKEFERIMKHGDASKEELVDVLLDKEITDEDANIMASVMNLSTVEMMTLQNKRKNT